jgi:histidine triad (HIT) family protein
MSFVFTKIIRRELPARILYEDNDFLSIIPKDHFVNPGHILVIPKLEVDHVWDLPGSIYTGLWDLCRMLSPPLKKVTSAERIGIAVEGFTVPHVHVHLCPLYAVGELDPHRKEDWPATKRDEFAEAFRALIHQGLNKRLEST